MDTFHANPIIFQFSQNFIVSKNTWLNAWNGFVSGKYGVILCVSNEADHSVFIVLLGEFYCFPYNFLWR